MQDRILIVDDEQDECELLVRLTRRLDYVPIATTSPEVALDLVGKEPLSAILTDLGMSSMGGLELCSRIMGARPDVPVIVVTGLGSMEAAIEAMRAGAYDFLNKPVDANALGLSLRRAVQHHRLQEEIRILTAPSSSISSEWMIGESEPVKRVKEIVSRVGPSEATVLVHGETGTGKELVARAVHRFSARSEGPFVAINCAAVPASLLESELFGHARGAFTDAKVSRDGLFVRASGGTLFLDEIGEMPLEMQAKLLRALQERVVRPVGSNSEVPFDTRIVAATNRDLRADVAAGRFREDLYFRLAVAVVPLPALRQRLEDLPQLVYSLLADLGRSDLRVSDAAFNALRTHGWPGNVRELKNALACAVAFVDPATSVLEPKHLRLLTAAANDDTSSIDGLALGGQRLEVIERAAIRQTLAQLDGNKAYAARALGIAVSTLYEKLKKYQL